MSRSSIRRRIADLRQWLGWVEAIDRDSLTGDAYFDHRLALAGCKHPVFEPAAIEAVYQATSGLPRRIGLLGHHALLAAAIAKANNVTTEHVQAALDELA